MATHVEQLLLTQRNIVRLERDQRRLNRQLKKVKKDLRLERKHRKALVAHVSPSPAIMPSKVFGEARGYDVSEFLTKTEKTVSAETDAFVESL